MPTQREVAVPLANYPSGTRQVTARNVPDWATHIAFEFERCTSADPTLWPNASTTLSIALETFVDGVWLSSGGFGGEGGIMLDPDGEFEVDRSFGRFSLHAGTNRQVRATIVISNGPLRTRGHIEMVG